VRDDLRHNLATESRTARAASDCSASQSAQMHLERSSTTQQRLTGGRDTELADRPLRLIQTMRKGCRLQRCWQVLADPIVGKVLPTGGQQVGHRLPNLVIVQSPRAGSPEMFESGRSHAPKSISPRPSRHRTPGFLQ
jgi:hypothetical protein